MGISNVVIGISFASRCGFEWIAHDEGIMLAVALASDRIVDGNLRGARKGRVEFRNGYVSRIVEAHLSS